MSGRKGWLGRMLGPSRAERRPASRFIAYRLTGSSVRQNPVRDISSTGAYIVTNERLDRGTLVLLTMQQDGPLELSATRRITTFARIVRVGEDGMGVEFVVPADPDACRWATLIDNLAEQTNPSDMLTFLRMCQAVGFLSRICRGASEQFEQLFRGRLSSHKIANAAAIALRAESLLSTRPDQERLRADPEIVIRILEVGACADEQWLRDDWAGLLAVCCSIDGSNQTDLKFVELFSQLTATQSRIVTLICVRTSKRRSDNGQFLATPAMFATEELAFGISLREAQIERDLEILSDIGLLTRGCDNSRALLLSDAIDLAPTHTALELHSRCQGHRGSLDEFYL
jgi:PilZ domain